MTRKTWNSDVPISRPVVNKDLADSVSVSLQGFAFTPQGLTFDLTEADAQEFYSPTQEQEPYRG